MKLTKIVYSRCEKENRPIIIQFVKDMNSTSSYCVARTSAYIYTPLDEDDSFFYCISYKYEVPDIFEDYEKYEQAMEEIKETIEDFDYDNVPYNNNDVINYEQKENIVPAWIIE